MKSLSWAVNSRMIAVFGIFTLLPCDLSFPHNRFVFRLQEDAWAMKRLPVRNSATWRFAKQQYSESETSHFLRLILSFEVCPKCFGLIVHRGDRKVWPFKSRRAHCTVYTHFQTCLSLFYAPQ